MEANMTEQVISSIMETGVIGVILVVVVMFLRNYINRHDDYVKEQDNIQNGLVNQLIELLNGQREVMQEVKNSIVELTAYIKTKENEK